MPQPATPAGPDPPKVSAITPRGRHWRTGQAEWRTSRPRAPQQARAAPPCPLCEEVIEPGTPVHAWTFTGTVHETCWQQYREEPPEVAAAPPRRTVSPSGYRAYITSPQWQVTRQRFWASDLPKDCFCCGRVDGPKDLHHRTYKNLGAENLRDLVPLCRSCHDRVHDLAAKQVMDLWGATNMIRRERRHVRDSERPRIRRQSSGWLEIWTRPGQVVHLRQDEAAGLVRLLTGGPPWGKEGRVRVRAIGEWVQVWVDRGAKEPRSVCLRAGEVAEVAAKLASLTDAPGLGRAAPTARPGGG